jgi:DTW domain-containing protein YfiP
MPSFTVATRLVVVMHHKETAKSSATAPLAKACLTNCELRVHGLREAPLDLTELKESHRRLLLLFPREDAQVLTKQFLQKDPRPVTLVVPDGNWRQASTMGRRIPGLDAAENVKLPMGDKTRWGLRFEHRDDGLATFEAIARALGILESRSLQAGMEAVFDLMVRKTIASKGR